MKWFLAAIGLVFSVSSMAADTHLPPLPSIKAEPKYTPANYYLRLDGGQIKTKFGEQYEEFAATTTKKQKKKTEYSLGIGVYMIDQVRADLTFSNSGKLKETVTYQVDDIAYAQPVTVESMMLMGHLYYDIHTFYGLTPYVTVGVGAARNSIKKMTVTTINGDAQLFKEGSKTSIAWELGAGLSYRMMKRLHIDVSYRIQGRGKVSTKNATDGPKNLKLKLRSHGVYAGLRWDF